MKLRCHPVKTGTRSGEQDANKGNRVHKVPPWSGLIDLTRLSRIGGTGHLPANKWTLYDHRTKIWHFFAEKKETKYCQR